LPQQDNVRCTELSLASKHFIGAGVTDADYRGQVKVLLFNHSEKEFKVKEGDRIAQLLLERISTPDVVEVQGRVLRLLGGLGVRIEEFGMGILYILTQWNGTVDLKGRIEF
jgi:hypothetical protein